MIDPPAHRPSVNLRGLALVLGGGALVLVSFRVLDWYAVPRRGIDLAGDSTFGALRSSSDQLGGSGVATAYFDWLSWTLLIGVSLLGAAATVPSAATDAARVAGFLLGFLGVAGTVYALLQHRNSIGSGHFVLYNATWGVWAALAGFAAAAVGAVLGPQAARVTGGAAPA